MTGWGCFLGLANLILDHRIRCNWPESGARNRPPRSHLRDTSTRRPLRVIIDALVFTGIILQALQHGNVLLNSNDAVTVFSQVLHGHPPPVDFTTTSRPFKRNRSDLMSPFDIVDPPKTVRLESYSTLSNSETRISGRCLAGLAWALGCQACGCCISMLIVG
jgi:hypothetical protein